MPYELVLIPGAVTAGTAISIPAYAPPIRRIYEARLFRGSDGTVAAAEVSVAATRVSRTSFSLNADTTTRDILILKYEADYEKLRP